MQEKKNEMKEGYCLAFTLKKESVLQDEGNLVKEWFVCQTHLCRQAFIYRLIHSLSNCRSIHSRPAAVEDEKT